ncbi:hypothetical protein M8756_15710 [Lutimaribacter sp. EGI FJ00015]|uniref:Uncharacterized protein n=1 Tax=Lutimaribacter degradans TaxID=2945989 RepID=A0ACC6A0G9_9RHOB|nr:hypothetical protein [Lutimaribacter sp. EGI FJ00013]MCO0614767.1 hypothetical protein [Lutimaribacter sp. EGI FJ00015]MCO0637436.1 hypothetical protein [Lutimaribacter sp. EGI FJ00014]
MFFGCRGSIILGAADAAHLFAGSQRVAQCDDAREGLKLRGNAVYNAFFTNYLAAAREKTWERMRGLMAEHPMGDGMYDELIGKFYDLEAEK